MTVDQRDEAIASFIDATREIVEAGRVMGSTLAAIRSELALHDGEKARAEIAALHVESARFAARAKNAEDRLLAAQATIRELEFEILGLRNALKGPPAKPALLPALPPEPKLEDRLDRPFSEALGCSTRLRRLLVRIGCSTLRDVLQRHEAYFLKHRGFGKVMLAELRGAVASVGATLGQLAHGQGSRR